MPLPTSELLEAMAARPPEYPEPKDHLSMITSRVIDHVNQRYDTVGDYFKEGEINQFTVSKSRPHYEFMVLMHELIEWYLTTCKGIPIDQIDAFDKKFEEMRNKFPEIVGNKEPGDDPSAPYFKEHQIATRIEKWIGDILEVNWDKYESDINNLS